MAPQGRVPAFGNWENAGSISYTECFQQAGASGNIRISKRVADPKDSSQVPETYSHDGSNIVNATQHKTVPDPEGPKSPKASKHNHASTITKKAGKVDHIAAATVHSEDILSRVPKRDNNMKDSSKASETYAHYAHVKVNATSHQNIPKPKDASTVRNEAGNMDQTAGAAVHKQDMACKSRKDRTLPQRANAQKSYVNGAATSPSQDDFLSESKGAKRKTKARPIDLGCHTHAPIAPPFEGWEIDPKAANNYTETFGLIGEIRRTPSPIVRPLDQETHEQNNTECKGCGCLSWIFKRKTL